MIRYCSLGVLRGWDSRGEGSLRQLAAPGSIRKSEVTYPLRPLLLEDSHRPITTSMCWTVYPVVW